jgi:hypothetical protein
MNAKRLTILREVLRAMQRHPQGRGLHEADLKQTLGGLDELDLYYLTDAALLYRQAGYLKLSARGMDVAEQTEGA